MRRKRYTVPLFDYSIEVIDVEDLERGSEESVLRSLMNAHSITPDMVDEYARQVNSIDGGVTFFCPESKDFLVVIYRQSSGIKRAVTAAHEKRHVEDDILKHCNIDDAETAAYLAGWLSTIIK